VLSSHKNSATMVEKAVDNDEETVMVEAFSDLSRRHAFGEHTVGAAIEAFEEISSGLFSLQVFSTAKVEEDKSVTKFSLAGKLLRLPLMIELGITAAIDQNKATHQSIGKLTDKSALVEGNIVALFLFQDKNSRAFIRIYGTCVDWSGGPKAINALPFEWDSERFLVVNAGNGRIALYSPTHRRFLASRNRLAEASVYPIGKLDDSPRCNEIFRVEDAPKGSAGQHVIQLHCDMDDSRAMHVIHKNFIYFQVVQIHGFEPAK
jgi:hypothetical protein